MAAAPSSVIRISDDRLARSPGPPTGEPDWQIPVEDTWNRAATIAVPVLALNGDLDAADHIGMAERLARTVADGRATMIAGAAHYPSMERLDAYNDALVGFLRAL